MYQYGVEVRCYYTESEYMCILFFNQKTAYEMRISDWSSDVCSSDLGCCRGRPICGACPSAFPPEATSAHLYVREYVGFRPSRKVQQCAVGQEIETGLRKLRAAFTRQPAIEFRSQQMQIAHVRRCIILLRIREFRRSEEHTSELQSLMRISYAVFCLTKTYNIAPHSQRYCDDKFNWLNGSMNVNTRLRSIEFSE